MKKKKKVVSLDIIGEVSENIKKKNEIKLATDNIYIPNFQAKDIFISLANGVPLPIKNDKGEINRKKFISTLDYSIEQVKLREVFKKIYSNEKELIIPLYNVKNEIIKIFSDSIISIKFDYSCKTWNQINLYDERGKKYKAYVRYGEFVTLDQFKDCLAFKNNKLIGAIVDVKVEETKKVYPFYINKEKNTYNIYDNYNSTQYMIIGDEEIDLNVDNMRTILYNNGFDYNGIHYIRYKRANGAARKGTILFIDENLYTQMRKYELLNLEINDSDSLDLAGEEAYISLTLSGCETKEIIHINRNEILFVPELTKNFKTECISVSESNGSLNAENKEVEITNNLIDGEALIESDLLNGCGMSLCRERWFKACAFATRLQKFFKDKGITDISQLNGITLATDISQIKLVINSSCVKMLKFDKSEDAIIKWLNNIECNFYVVKHEHESKFFNNKMVQAHYQLLNTLQLSYTQMEKLLEPSFEYMNLFNTDVNVFRYHMNSNYNDSDNELDNVTPIDLLNITEKAFYNNIFKDIKVKTRNDYRKNMLQGHILIKGNYSVLFGNPLHYLYHTIGKESEANEINGAECMTINSNFKYNEDVVLCRSPHVFCGNLALVKNVYKKEIDDYFALTDNIICINAVNENIMERLSSCDYDSDQAIVTNEKSIVAAVKKNYDKFGVPTSLVKDNGKNEYYYTMNDLAKLDINIARQSKTIGDIINTSQVLQSVMWNLINNDMSFENPLIQNLIKDCAMLDVMSCICIDSAKKDYSHIDLKQELSKLKCKYNKYITNDKGQVTKPDFFKVIEELKKFDKPDDKYKSYDTAMSYLYKIINNFRTKSLGNDLNYTLADVLQIRIPCNKNKISKNQIIDILNEAEKTNKNLLSISTKKYDGWYSDYLIEKKAFNTYINELSINIYTAYKLIRMLDENNEKIRKVKKLITVAILSSSKIMNMFINNMNIEDYYTLEEITESIEKVDYNLYNLKFKKILKNPPLCIETA